jgi:hypothetical protein
MGMSEDGAEDVEWSRHMMGEAHTPTRRAAFPQDSAPRESLMLFSYHSFTTERFIAIMHKFIPSIPTEV